MISIVKQITFCAGHRLMGHEGMCRYLHGHNYLAEIRVSGYHLDSVGRLVDFADIKCAFKGWIDHHWDHGFILNEADEEAIKAVNMMEESRCFLMPCNPTAENMALYLLEEVPFGSMRVDEVTIWETPNSSATASRKLPKEGS